MEYWWDLLLRNFKRLVLCYRLGKTLPLCWQDLAKLMANPC